MTQPNDIKFELTIDGVPRDGLSFVSFRAAESLCEAYELEVDALCARMDPEALIGRSAALYLRFTGSPERAFHGVIWNAQLSPMGEQVFQLHLQIVPRLYTLALGRNSRVFTDSSLVAVVKKVLAGAGLPESACDWQVDEGPAHTMVVQYDESDYDFIRRLLFEEGIAFLIQNDSDAERVVFFDRIEALLDTPGLTQLVDRRRQDARYDSVFDLREEMSATCDGVMLRDYDPDQPGRPADATFPDGAAPGRQLYAYPGGHRILATRARRTFERLRMNGHTLHGGSYWPHLEPGRHVALDSEVRASCPPELTFIAVVHEGYLHRAEQLSYSNRFVAIPKGTACRPQVAPAAPLLGTQHAVVTGPAGQELHGDEQGRVKLRYAWDRSGTTDDKSSAFARVGQAQLSGSMIMPRVGFPVLVQQELDDADRPCVIGHLYDEETPPPYGSAHLSTSSIQTATTEGGAGANELRLDTDAGSEQMLMNASYDMTMKVDNTLHWNVAKNETIEVGANTTLSVKAKSTSNVGATSALEVGAMQDLTVGVDYSEAVAGNQSLQIGAARTATVGGDQIETIAGKLERTVGAMQTVLTTDGFTRAVTGNSTVNVGAAWAETVKRSKSSTVSGSRVEQVGALKLVDAKQVGIVAEAAYAEKVASQKVKTAKDRADSSGSKLQIEAKGGLSIEADNITFSASDQLTFSAGKVTITLKKTGEVEVKAKQLTIKNAKAFKQITHKTN